MVLAQDLRLVIIFWAIVGGLGASLLLPAMQSLIHGNFEGAAQRRVYAMVGAAAAIAAAIGPLVGGFITTVLVWRVGFALEVVVIAVVLSGLGLVKDVKFTGERRIDLVGAAFSVFAMGGVVLGILVWQEGGEAVAALLAIGFVSLALLAWWLVRRKRRGRGAADRSRPVQLEAVPHRHQRADDAADRPGRADDRAAHLPADGAGVHGPGGRPDAGPAVAEHVRGRHAGRSAGRASAVPP